MLIATLIGLCAWVYVVILTRNGMIFHGIKTWLESSLNDWVTKPIIGCEYCVSGQLAFWYYLFMFDYNFFEHVAFVCISIFTVTIINKIMYGQP